MSTTTTNIRTRDTSFEIGALRSPAQPEAARRIVLRSAGRKRGPITRLVSPSDLGELIKPFVFLDHAELPPTGEPFFGIHPHSGIATLTAVSAADCLRGHDGQVRPGTRGWPRVDESRRGRLA